MIPTVPWSCEVKEDPVVQDRHNSHTKIHNCSTSLKKMVSCNVPQQRTKKTQRLAFLFHNTINNFVCGRNIQLTTLQSAPESHQQLLL
jgi:hypothetical protein